MPSINEIVKQWSDYSDRISIQVRTIAIGTLATSWGLIIGNTTITYQIRTSFKNELIMICITSILILFFDFLQYVFGYWNLKALLKELESTGKKEGEYQYDLFYWFSYFFFWAKQISTACCVILLVAILWRALMR